MLFSIPALGAEVVKIGVLAFRPKPQTLAQWQPLAVALKQAIPGHDFVVEAYSYPELNEAIAQHRVDFVLTNPGHYVMLAQNGGLSAPLATVAFKGSGQRTSLFGGVIFTRAGQTAIATLSDLRGRAIAAPDTESLGGYQAQAFELSQIGIHFPQDARLQFTGMPHDTVVKAVLAGRADVGFVRSGVLEGMARDGKLDLHQIKVINPQNPAHFSEQVSTRLYPGWPFAALPEVDESLARQVAVALLLVEDNNSAATTAMGIQGFSVPANYGSVEALLRALRLPPFDAAPPFTFKDIWARYRWQISGALLIAGLFTWLLVRLQMSHRKLAAAHRLELLHQQQLQESEEAFRTVADYTYDWELWEDPGGAIVYCSPSCQRITGYPPDAFKADPRLLERLMHPEDRANWQAHRARVHAATGPEAAALMNGDELEFRLLRPDGDIRWISHVCHPIHDATGLYRGHRITNRDITERKRAEEALRESEERFKALHNASFGGISIHDQGLIIECNQGLSLMTGYSQNELIGMNGLLLIAPDWREFVTNKIVSGFELPYEAMGVRKNGELFPMQLEARNIHYKGKKVRTVEFRDITERKQAESENRQLQAQLYQSQKMESLGTLAGGVAHDMNNVLGAILGLASAQIGSQPTGSPLHQALDTICKAAERGGKMVKSLLSFARQSPAEEHELDLNGILREQISLLERTTLAKVRLETDLDANLRPMLGDASALTNVFMNLCVNAVDAMPANGTLTLHTRNVDNDWIEVVVEDNGTGMPKEVLEKAMDPFFTTKETGKGTGLGLSMVFSTVKAHRGQMAIESEPGQGTRVRLRFPACAQEAPVQAEPSVAEATVAPHGSLKVLLIDDDDLIQSSVLAILEFLGHTAVKTAPSGEAALALLEAGFEPDLVILDMNMPGLGGIGTLPRLRALRPEVPVLLATGRVDQTALTLASAHPGVTLLSKPFGLRELQKHLESIGLG
jgi:PAS domain S-box-containing protein